MKKKLFAAMLTFTVFTAVLCACGNKEEGDIPVTAHLTATETPVPGVTQEPTAEPTATPVPTVAPTATPEPTVEPTATPVPTVVPTATPEPTLAPTAAPTATPAPTVEPTPTVAPTVAPAPTAEPTPVPAPVVEPAPVQAAGTPVVPGATYTQQDVDDYCRMTGDETVLITTDNGTVYTVGCSWARYGWACKVVEGIAFDTPDMMDLWAQALGDNWEAMIGRAEPDYEIGVPTLSYEILDLVNADRADNGADPLVWSEELAEMALVRAQESVAEWAEGEKYNYDSSIGNWAHAGAIARGWFGENAGIQYDTDPDHPNQAWIGSEGHHTNRCSSGYTKYAAAWYAPGDGKVYWVELFR